MKREGAWWTFVALIAAELALAIASITWRCTDCDGSTPRLGILGAVWYGAVLVLSLVGARREAFWGGMIAAGAHVALVATLLASGRLCSICFAAGAVAIGVVVAALKADDDNLTRLSRAVAAGAIAAQLALVGGWIQQTRTVTQVVHEQQPTSVDGRVRLVAYERADCHYCDELERDVLPSIVKQFGDKLRVERRDASARPELPTPTVIVSGPGGHDVFPGLPTVAMLSESILARAKR